MKKKLQNRDISKIEKSKLVRLELLPIGFRGAANFSAYQFNFPSDSQLDGKIITGIICHAPSDGSNGGDVPTATTYAPNYYDDYTGQQLIDQSLISNLYLTLVNKQENYFWKQQVLSSLFVKNCGKYIKRFYQRIKLDKCFVELPNSSSFTFDPNIRNYILFTFFYIDDPNY